jgi:hypothetical protein
VGFKHWCWEPFDKAQGERYFPKPHTGTANSVVFSRNEMVFPPNKTGAPESIGIRSPGSPLRLNRPAAVYSKSERGRIFIVGRV